jgi:primosomal protein N' (replication factor Y)
MEQVSGRAGRKEATGKVLIQTIQPSHPVLQMVQQHDLKKMVEVEIEKRKQLHYQPFTRLIHVTFKHKMKEVVEKAAREYASSLHSKYGQYFVGPAEPVINRVRNRFLMEMLVKLPRDGKLIAQCKEDMLEQVAILHQQKNFKSVTVVNNVDVM